MKKNITHKLKYAGLVFFTTILLTSCTKDNNDTNPEPETNTKTVVYTTGNGWGGDKLIGIRYYKDEQIVPVTTNAQEIIATGIWVDNGDVYISGEERMNSTVFVPKYWKNGKAVALSEGSMSGFTHSILVNKGDVYVTGAEFTPVLSTSVAQAKYWKNGIAFPLSEKIPQRNAAATAIAVDGDDVYVGGFERIGSKTVAKYWKNGAAVALSDGSNHAEVYGIAVVDGKVHVAGHERINDVFVATHWLDGVATRLTGYDVGNMATGMAISNGQVYISLNEQNTPDPYKAKYWKVGKSVVELTSGTENAFANGIAVDGDDVYVVGEYKFSGGWATACIWKNGEISQLSKGGSDYVDGKGIFLSKEPISN